MKKFFFFILGAVVGLIVCFVILYSSGTLLEYFNIQLYNSEADQQRNFNIFIVASVIISVICGFLFAKKLA